MTSAVEKIYSQIRKAQLCTHIELSSSVATDNIIAKAEANLRMMITGQETHEKCHYFSYFLKNYIQSDPSKIPFDTGILTEKERTLFLSKKELIPIGLELNQLSATIQLILSTYFQKKDVLFSILSFSTIPSLFSFFKIQSIFETYCKFISTLYESCCHNLIQETKPYLFFCQPLFISPHIIHFTSKVFRPIFHSFFEDPAKSSIDEYKIINPTYESDLRDEILQNVKKNRHFIPTYLHLFLMAMKQKDETVPNEIIKRCFFRIIINSPMDYFIVDFWISKKSKQYKMIKSLLESVLMDDDFICSFTQLLMSNTDNQFLDVFIHQESLAASSITNTTVIDNVDLAIFSFINDLQNGALPSEFKLNQLVPQYNAFEGYYETNVLSSSLSQSLTNLFNSYDCLRKLLRQAPLLPTEVPNDIDGDDPTEIFKNIVEKYLFDKSNPFQYAKQQMYYQIITNSADFKVKNITTQVQRLCQTETNQMKELSNLFSDYTRYHSLINDLLDDYRTYFISELAINKIDDTIFIPQTIKDMKDPLHLLKQFTQAYESFPVKPGAPRAAVTLERVIFPYLFSSNITFYSFLALRPDLSYYDNLVSKFFSEHYFEIFENSLKGEPEQCRRAGLCIPNFHSYINEFRSIFESNIDPYSKSKLGFEVIKKFGCELTTTFDLVTYQEKVNLFDLFIAFSNPPYLVSTYIFLLDYMVIPFLRYSSDENMLFYHLNTLLSDLVGYSDQFPKSYLCLSHLVFHQIDIFLVDEGCTQVSEIYAFLYSKLNSLISKKNPEIDLQEINKVIDTKHSVSPVYFDEINPQNYYFVRLVLSYRRISKDSTRLQFKENQNNSTSFVFYATDTNHFFPYTNPAIGFMNNNVKADFKNTVTSDSIKDLKQQDKFNQIDAVFNEKVRTISSYSSSFC